MTVAIINPNTIDGPLRDAIVALAGEIERRDGAPPLSDQALIRLGSDGVVHLVARGEDGQLRGYAQLDGASAEVAGDDVVVDELLAELEQRAPTFEVWAHGERSPIARVADARGYQKQRLLWQLRRPLTAFEPAHWPDGIALRTFRVGADEPAWLAVNAAAFAHHPEQGGWQLDDLVAREGEPWFDPSGFLIADRDGEMLGFHWTKRHPDAIGEVYVLAVSPSAQGLGLGRALLDAGLDHLLRGGSTEAMLYVDDSNATAVQLYEKNGFRRANLDAQYQHLA